MTEPVTPELVLVDPELAPRARAELPEPVLWSPPGRPPTKRPHEPSAHDHPPEVRPSRRLSSARATALLLALGLAASAVALALAWRTEDRPTLLPRAGDPNPEQASPSAPRERAATADRQTQPRSGRQRREASRAGEPGARNTATTQPRKSSADAQEVSAAPQTFVWLPVEGATHYQVEFLRDDRRVFLAFPSRARLVIAGSWQYRGRTHRFRPGRYLWVVRAGFGLRPSSRYGEPVVRSTWTFS